MLFLAVVKDFAFFAKLKIQFKRGMVHCFAEGTFVNCMQSPQIGAIVGSYEELIENSWRKFKIFAFCNMYIKVIGITYGTVSDILYGLLVNYTVSYCSL